MSAAASGAQAPAGEERLLAEIRALLEELAPGRTERLAITLDSSLDRDLALDSLSRVELLARLERAYSVSLPHALLAQVETPRDLLRALAAAAPAGAQEEFVGPRTPATGGAGDSAPTGTATLLEALEWHAAAHPERVHVHLYESGRLADEITYSGLLEGARELAAGLREHGLEAGASAAIMLPTGRDYLETFVAIGLLGAIPVPIYPPARIAQIEDHFRRHSRILANARATHLVTFEEVRAVSRLLTAQVPGLGSILTVGDLRQGGGLAHRPTVRPGDIAFLQYTSGSTGEPKGVVLTHRDVLESLRSMREALEASADDVFVSWLPLYHDMGLIGAWMGALVVGFPLVLMSPLDFLSRPERWLRAIAAHRGTMSGGPNFAYDLCTRRLHEAALEGLDLSSWRVAFNGAEPVAPQTLRRFEARFAGCGLAPGALTPVYGLAEATLGVAFTPVGRGPRFDVVSRAAMRARGRAEPAREGEESLTYVSSGVPIPRFEVRIVDGADHELPDRVEGAVQFAGPSTTGGYFRNAEASKALLHGRWLDSGDRGYVAGGELYITGRSKDLIIRAGRNIHPHEVESIVATVDGVRQGCVAVFAARAEGEATERLVVVAETRERDPAARDAMADAIRARVGEHVDVAPDEVVLAEPHTVLKTSSGKIRRAAVRERYETGRLRAARRAVWLQLASLAVAGLGPRLASTSRAARAFGYAGLAWALTVPAALLAWLAVVSAARPETAWRRLGRIGRALLGALGVPVEVSGAGRMPARGPLVLVANHSSFLDGLVLAVALPRPVAFVAKGELARNAPVRLFLRRLGCRFVERFDAERGVSDAAALDATPAAGGVLGVFPEGTFHRMSGLLAFHLGAFACAARVGAPVLPVVIRGTRSVLRGDEFFPRRGRVSVEVLEPIAAPGGDPWHDAVALRDEARAAILVRCGEPDLADRRPLLDHPAAGR